MTRLRTWRGATALGVMLTLGGLACGRYGPPVRTAPRPGVEQVAPAPAQVESDEDEAEPSERR